MKKLIILAVALSAVLLLLFYCTDYKFDNPLDKNGTNYLFGDTTGEKEKIGDANGNGISDLFDPKYTVTFYANGGGGSLPPAQTVLKDLSINLPSGDGLSRTGYTFDRWCTTPSGMGTYHDAGSVFTPSLNMSFYARWKLILYTVEFDANGGTVSPTSDTTGEGWKLTTLPTPTRSGYTFKGWWTTETTGGDSVTVSWVYNADATIYARWEEGVTQPTTYTLTVTRNLTDGGSTTPDSSQSNIAAGTAVNISATAESGYTFVNWTVTSGSATIADANSAATTVTLNNNATIQANFKQYDTPPEVVVGTLADNRDGKTYKTVKIGEQTWMAENLNYDVPNVTSDVCYNNSADSCAKYGRLYNWATAMGGTSSSSLSPSGVQGVCPAGWHIPSDAEWTTLVDYVDYPAGTKLKATSGWYNNGNGTDQYGFSALPGGYGISDGGFYNAGIYGIWWVATENNASGRGMGYNVEYLSRDDNDKTSLYSVRCVMDDN
jgi:uncharacterized protein (TIGR02145 family)/uncharacterized repeat protein (TIGR02543 family)